MRNINLLYFITIVASVVALFVFFNKIKILKSEKVRYLKDESFYQNTYSDDLRNQFKAYKLDNNFLIDEKLNRVALADLMESSNWKFIVRIRENQCMDCLDTLFEKIGALAKSVGEANILVFASFHDASAAMKFKKIKQIPFVFYNITAGLTTNSLETSDMPYMFILDSSLKPWAIHSFNSAFSKITSLYLNTIKKEFENRFTLLFSPIYLQANGATD